MTHETDPAGAQRRQLSDEMEECVENSLQAHRVCLDTLIYCVDAGGEVARATLLKRLMDAAEISQTAAHFLLRGSELHPRACGLCAEVCTVAAEACEEFAADEQLRACAAACRAAAASCGEMASLMTA